MVRERRTPKGGGRSPREHGIVARFADGSNAWYHRVGDRSGQEHERWGWESQATRFPSAADAEQVAAGMQVNSDARNYEVVPLPPGRPGPLPVLERPPSSQRTN